MTRARDELVLTSASDYGTSRARKVSRFVVEALDLPSPRPAVAEDAAARGPRAPRARAPSLRPPARSPIPEDELLRLSYGQIDDYETCPLKYRYVHVLRVPLLTHHAVVYGHAVHEAVRRHFEARLAGRRVLRGRPRGGLPRGLGLGGLPLARARGASGCATGEEMLRRFHAEEARGPVGAHRRRGGVRVRPRAQPRAGPLRPRDRAGGRGRDRGLQDRRRARREGRRRSGRRRACSSTSTPSRT